MQTKAIDTFDNPESLVRDVYSYLNKVGGNSAIGVVNVYIYAYLQGKKSKDGFVDDLYNLLEKKVDQDKLESTVNYIVGLADRYMQKAGTKAFDNPFSDPPVFFYRKDEDFYSVYYKNNQWVVTHESRDHNDKKAVLTTKNIPDVVNYFSQQRLSTSGVESELTGYLKRHSSEKSLDWFKGK